MRVDPKPAGRPVSVERPLELDQNRKTRNPVSNHQCWWIGSERPCDPTGAVAPFLAPFIRESWSRYLNAAPLAVVLLGWLVLHENMATTFGQMGADNPFSYRWGFYLLLAACLALAANALKSPTVYSIRGSAA